MISLRLNLKSLTCPMEIDKANSGSQICLASEKERPTNHFSPKMKKLRGTWKNSGWKTRRTIGLKNKRRNKKRIFRSSIECGFKNIHNKIYNLIARRDVIELN